MIAACAHSQIGFHHAHLGCLESPPLLERLPAAHLCYLQPARVPSEGIGDDVSLLW